MKKIAVIFNRDSGSFKKMERDPEDWITEVFNRNSVQDVSIKVSVLESKLINENVNKYISENYDIIAASGGDGTINGIANLIKDSSAALGVIPMGTFNHFAKDAGVPLGFEEAVLNLVNGTVKKIDYGMVNNRIFLNNSSIGQYPTAVLLRERKRKGTGINKKLAMVWASLKTSSKYPLTKIRAEVQGSSEEVETPLVFIGNNMYDLQPLNIGQRTSLTAGKLFGYGVKCRNVFCSLHLAFLAFFNSLKLSKMFVFLPFEELTIHSRKKVLNVAVDGEIIALPTPVKYNIMPKSLPVILPADSNV